MTILVLLATVPVPQHVTYSIDSLVTGPTQRGCGETLFDLYEWALPAGKLIHLSWSTNPAADVFVNMSTILTDTFGPTFFWGHGSSGANSFYANGGAYEVNVTNCGSQQTTVTISASYNSSAPLF